jgi:hypothetical protein
LDGGGAIMEFEALKKYTILGTGEVKNIFLIANTHRKTMKYYLALAKGSPRVSSKWVYKCKEKVLKKTPPVIIPLNSHFVLE